MNARGKPKMRTDQTTNNSQDKKEARIMKPGFFSSMGTLALASVLMLITSVSAQAAVGDTTAGQDVTNRASLQFTVGSSGTITVESAPGVGNSTSGVGNGQDTVFRVDHKVRPVVTATSGAADVFQNGTNHYLTFTVTNDGNKDGDFRLMLEQTGDFAMNAVHLWLDDGDGVLDGGDTDLGLASGTIVRTIARDVSIVVHVVGNTPTALPIPTDGQTSVYDLMAVAWSAGAQLANDANGDQPLAEDVVWADDAGSAVTGFDTNGDDAFDGYHSAQGTFTFRGVALNVTKTEAIIYDPYGLAVPYHLPGTYIQYTITIENTGPSNQSASLTQIADALDTAYATFDTTFVDAAGTGQGGAVQVSTAAASNGRGTTSNIHAVGAGVVTYADPNLTINLANALPAGGGYTAGELKLNEIVTIRYNVMIKAAFP